MRIRRHHPSADCGARFIAWRKLTSPARSRGASRGRRARSRARQSSRRARIHRRHWNAPSPTRVPPVSASRRSSKRASSITWTAATTRRSRRCCRSFSNSATSSNSKTPPSSASKEDWLAVVEYVQAIAALAKGDKDAFKKHITEAFWLSPRQAAAFAPHIERLRLRRSHARSENRFRHRMPRPSTAATRSSLKALIDGKKALLLHFWSPWSHECEAAMPDFITTAGMLSANGFRGRLAGARRHAEAMLDDAAAAIASVSGATPPGMARRSEERPLARELRVQNLPTMVIVSTDGKVLFNGDPADRAFWES